MATDDPAAPKNTDEIVPLSRFRAALARARTTRRADAILADPNADRLIPSLPVQDLYFAIKDVGLTDAEELVGLATPQQLQGFFDLDAWVGDELSIDHLRPWIDMLTTQGYERIAQVVELVDPELIALYVQKQAAVYDLTQDEVPEDPEGHFYPTPDTFYLLDVRVAGEDGKSFERFIDHLYRADLSLARRVLMGARWELPSDLEEWSFRFRSGRMADMGFPDPSEAMTIYRPLPLASVKIPAVGEPVLPAAGAIAVPGTALPALVADGIEPKSLLGQALASLQGEGELERCHAELVTLLNRAISADRVELADMAAARRVLDDVIAYLGLGLELLARGDAQPVERAATALRTVPMERIFRAGFTLTSSLGRLAETLFVRGRVRMGEPAALLLEGRHREVVSALRGVGTRGRRPQMARVLDTPPASGARPFRSAADIRVAASALESASRIPVFFFDDLGLSQASAAEAASSSPGIDFGTLARTIASRVLLAPALLDGKETFTLVPLRAAEVGSILARLEHGALTAADERAIGDAVAARLARRERKPAAEIEAWFAEWFAKLGQRVAEVDGLYVTG